MNNHIVIHKVSMIYNNTDFVIDTKRTQVLNPSTPVEYGSKQSKTITEPSVVMDVMYGIIQHAYPCAHKIVKTYKAEAYLIYALSAMCQTTLATYNIAMK